MANQEQLDILMQGVEDWNRWRKEYPDILPDLRGANLSEANLRGANLGMVRIGWTIFGANDLSTVEGLDTVTHLGPSTIGIDTIYKSKGNIPEGVRIIV